MNGVAARPAHVASLCAGIGALDLAVKLAIPSSRTVVYVERDSYAAAALVARMADQALDEAPVWDDVASFDTQPWRGAVDLVTAGIPCQPFSVAGKRRGTEDERWLWPDVWRVVRECDASRLFVECTPELVRHGLPVILGDLAEVGWAAQWGLLSAAEVGAPQSRMRFWLLADADRQPGRGVPGGPHGCEALPGPELHHHAGAVCGHVADGDGDGDGRRPDSGESVDDGHARDDAHRCGMPFPPGPEDADGWARVLAADPGLEPSLRRLADGAPGRVGGRKPPALDDRLRCLGNAVVPLAGALALRLLSERLGVMW